MLNYLAPAGTPVHTSELAIWLGRLLSGRQAMDELAESIKTRFGVRHCFFVSTGRGAMSLLLRAVAAERGNRSEVIIPGYTCYSVAGSVYKAGLSPIACDIDPDTLSPDLDQLQGLIGPQTLAVLSANLYGYPNDLPGIEEIARQHHLFLLDDAAQSLGARIGARFSGSFGDAGLYSLDKGKNITSIQGGVIVTNSDELAKRLQATIAALPQPGLTTSLSDITKMLLYSLILPPSRYWLTQHLPFLKLGRTVYTTDYPIEQYNQAMAALALLLFRRLDDITAQRQQNAHALQQALSPAQGMRFITPLPAADPACLRLPMLIDSDDRRQRLIVALNAAGIGATASYPEAIVDIPELQSILAAQAHRNPGARHVARSILTLPTHAYLRDSHIDRTQDVFRTQGFLDREF